MVLLDEPSAYLDVEQRIAVSHAIKRCVSRTGRTAFIVEHDIMMAVSCADRVLVYSGEPGVKCSQSAPTELGAGMNRFLAQVDVTFRRDHSNGRPRINKPSSAKDREQKKAGRYYV